MPSMKEILLHKGATVHRIEPDATVLEAAHLMNQQQVGAVLVTSATGLLGIFTERDLLRRVVGQSRDPAGTRVRDVMTTDVACGSVDTSLEEARGVMKNRRIRHLPILDEKGGLLGLVSLGDLNAWQLDGQEMTIRYLHDYIYGRA